jgi:hypothetical protein
MSFLDKLRNLFAGPPRVHAADEEEAAVLHEEFGAPDSGAAQIKHIEETGGGGGMIRGDRFAAQESAEAAEADLETEEAPPDPDS